MDSLLSMGFDAATARQALDVAGGNVDRALDILLGGGLNDQVSCCERYIISLRLSRNLHNQCTFFLYR